jgi:phospholipase/lecithinase/hemolysin
MRLNKFSLVAVASLTALVIAGCGGGGGAGNQSPKIQFTSQVTFGDSLSDVGTYDVGTVQALGGGRFTVNTFLANGAHAPTNYTELLAATLRQSAPCPAETGLDGLASDGFSVPVVMYTPQCTGYAQGGARVTSPYGPGNIAFGPPLGALTVPVVTQIATHLQAHGGKFSGTEIVFVLAGANDILVNFGGLAQGETPAQALAAVTQAATELAGYVNTQIIGNGANYVVVMNVPDISTTPFGTGAERAAAGSQALIQQLVTTYNSTLQAALSSPSILFIDLYTVSDQQISNPSIFGLTNVTVPACNLSAPTNPLASSLTCNDGNLIAGDVSQYEFADTVHPTPYGNILLARYVATQLVTKGWL